MVLQAVRYGLIKLLGAQTGVWVPGAGEIIVDIDRRNKISSISACLLYTSPSPRDLSTSRMPSSA